MTHICRNTAKFFLVALVVLLMGAGGFSYASHADTQKADSFIVGLGEEVIEVIAANQSNDKERVKALRAIFENSVDSEWVAKFVLGKHWRRATDDQQKRYLAAYTPFIVSTYAKRFNEYTGEVLKVTDSRKAKGDDVFVNTVLERPKAENVVIQFRVRSVGGKFRIFDVVVEGVSQLTTQRSEFNTIVSQSGLDALIERLEARANG